MAAYFREALNKSTRDSVIYRTVQDLQRIEFGTIVVRGVSGLVVGPVVADRLGKALVVVRKPGEVCHSWNPLAGQLDGSYVILDDFCASGETVDRILAAIEGRAPCVGFYGYIKNWWTQYPPPEFGVARLAEINVTPLNPECQAIYQELQRQSQQLKEQATDLKLTPAQLEGIAKLTTEQALCLAI